MSTLALAEAESGPELVKPPTLGLTFVCLSGCLRYEVQFFLKPLVGPKPQNVGTCYKMKNMNINVPNTINTIK